MEDVKSIDRDAFGQLLPFIDDDNITDIDINDGLVWTRNVHMQRENTNIQLEPSFINVFTNKVANMTRGGQLNQANPVLESDTSSLRFSIIHESVTTTGRSICIRKTPPKIRLTEQMAIDSGYMSKKTMNFLANCIKAGMTVVVGGEIGVGKTECIKFLTKYIGETERVVTLEDSPELHYKEIFPNRDCVSMYTSPTMNYSEALKAIMRQDCTRIILSEARSEEVKELMASLSSGSSGLTTLHTDDVRNIPSRILSMMPNRNDADRLENDVYSFIDVGIILRAKTLPDGKKLRYIDQLGIFSNTNGENRCDLLVSHGKNVETDRLPEKVMTKFEIKEIENPFVYADGLNIS